MIWDDAVVPMRPYPEDSQLQEPDTSPAVALLYDLLEADFLENDEWYTRQTNDVYASEFSNNGYAGDAKARIILPSKYDAVNIDDVVNTCKHLSADQRSDLRTLLSKFPTLFDGKLKVYPDEKMHLTIEPNAVPHRSRAYPIPRMHLQTFKDELDRLERIGVLEKAGRAEWITGTFVIPKKDQRVRWISDFRALKRTLATTNLAQSSNSKVDR